MIGTNSIWMVGKETSLHPLPEQRQRGNVKGGHQGCCRQPLPSAPSPAILKQPSSGSWFQAAGTGASCELPCWGFGFLSSGGLGFFLILLLSFFFSFLSRDSHHRASPLPWQCSFEHRATSIRIRVPRCPSVPSRNETPGGSWFNPTSN